VIMQTSALHRPILVLGGTAEGRELATNLVDAGRQVISSLAGRISTPRLPPGTVRVGGFGGADGLADYLRAQRISAVIDATHPFAAQITANAVSACRRTGTPLLVLRRPAWTTTDTDTWHTATDLTDAAAEVTSLPRDTAVLLTTGRQGAGRFSAAPQRFWLRAVEPPDEPLPARCDLILERGPFTLDGERNLLQRLDIGVLVTKNSGGDLTAAKLTAARELGLTVIMVDRPPLPGEVTSVPDVASALTWIGRQAPDRPAPAGSRRPDTGAMPPAPPARG
jgi:precorrin-6A/cobalt-precorrin-6A reductase